MEKDPEMKGDGNSYTTEFRQYDPRLGRWLSLDPLMAQLEKWSPYVAFENNPVIYNDPLGLKVAGGGDKKDKGDGGTKKKKIKTYDKPEQAAWDYAAVQGITKDVYTKISIDGSVVLYYKAISGTDEPINEGGIIAVRGGSFKASKKATRAYNKKIEKEQNPHGIYWTDPVELARNIEWQRNRAKSETIEKAFETMFLEVFYFASGEEVFAVIYESIYALRMARLARIAPNGEGIAKIGRWGESQLAKYLKYAGEKPAKAFTTSLGKRYVDRLVNGIAHEVKAGLNVTLTPAIKTQILKDAEMIAKDQVKGAVWHFMQGVDQKVLDFLNSNGISYIIH